MLLPWAYSKRSDQARVSTTVGNLNGVLEHTCIYCTSPLKYYHVCQHKCISNFLVSKRNSVYIALKSWIQVAYLHDHVESVEILQWGILMKSELQVLKAFKYKKYRKYRKYFTKMYNIQTKRSRQEKCIQRFLHSWMWFCITDAVSSFLFNS